MMSETEAQRIRHEREQARFTSSLWRAGLDHWAIDHEEIAARLATTAMRSEPYAARRFSGELEVGKAWVEVYRNVVAREALIVSGIEART